MSNEITVFGTEDFDLIAAATGVDVPRGPYFPQLRINREAETEDGKTVPVGTYSVSQGDKTLYVKTCLFRPFINTYQYMEYSPSENIFTNKSIYVKSFNEEAHDELGGLKCGKASRKAFELMGEADQAKQRNIKCNRVMFGIATLNDAVDSAGDKHQVAIPVMWRISGVNFMAVRDALAAIAKMRHHIFQHNLVLTTKRDKTGSNVWYHIIAEADLANVVSFSNEDSEVFHQFQEFIDAENTAVLEKWKVAKKSAFVDNDLSDLAKDFELDDELPAHLS